MNAGIDQSVRKINPVDRLVLNTDFVGGCWLYRGKPFCKFGYCRIGSNGSRELLHRFSFRTFVGPIPDGLLVLHRCVGHPHCWNPRHLYAGTHLDNVRDTREQSRWNARSGSLNNNSKLTESKVMQIKKELQTLSSGALSRKYKVSSGTIRKIRQGTLWRHV
jgi:hypothetical protein